MVSSRQPQRHWGDSFTFTPDDDGQYEIGVVVTASGRGGCAEATATVANVAPVVTLTDPLISGAGGADFTLGSPIDFCATATDASDVDLNAGIHYVWKVNGQTVEAETGAEFVFMPTVAGTYTISVGAYDKDMTPEDIAVTDILTRTIEVTDPLVHEGQTVHPYAAAPANATSISWTARKYGLPISIAGPTNQEVLDVPLDDNGLFDFVATFIVDGQIHTRTTHYTVSNVRPSVTLVSPPTAGEVGIRVSESTGSNTTYYLNDKANPTGYSQIVEEKSSPTATPSLSYIIGNDVIAQAAPGSAADAKAYYIYDGHGSVRGLADANGVFIAGSSYEYDAFGVGLNFTIATATSHLLYTGEAADAVTGMYYLRARFYNPTIDRFNRFDNFEGNLTDPGSLHKYVFTKANPIDGVDPTGNFIEEQTEVAEERGKLETTMYRSLPALRTVVSQQVATAATGSMIDLQLALTLSVGVGVGTTLVFNAWHSGMRLQMTQAVQTAQSLALTSTTMTRSQVMRLPIFFVFRSGPARTPQIWINDAAAIGRVTSWVVLNYFGPNPSLRRLNRRVALAQASRIGVVRTPGVTSIDEYPYATTREGGGAGPLVPQVAAVPVEEQSLQGGLLSGFYSSSLSGAPGTFLVALVP